MLGGTLGATTLSTGPSSLLSPVLAATTPPTVPATTDKPAYVSGHPMTLVVTENVTKLEGRRIVVTDSTKLDYALHDRAR